MNFIFYLNLEFLSEVCVVLSFVRQNGSTLCAAWFIVWTASVFLWRHGKNSLSNPIIINTNKTNATFVCSVTPAQIYVSVGISSLLNSVLGRPFYIKWI